MCSTGVPEKRASISPPMAFAAPGPVEEKITPEAAGNAGIAVRHVRAAEFAACHHEADGVAPADRIQHRDVVHRGDAERGGDAALREEFGHQIADGVVARHLELPLVVATLEQAVWSVNQRSVWYTACGCPVRIGPSCCWQARRECHGDQSDREGQSVPRAAREVLCHRQRVGRRFGAHPGRRRLHRTGDLERRRGGDARPARRDDHARGVAGARAHRGRGDRSSGFGGSGKGFRRLPPMRLHRRLRWPARYGLVGGSIEDATGDPQKPLFDPGHATERIAAAVAAARKAPFALHADGAGGELHPRQPRPGRHDPAACRRSRQPAPTC